MNIKVTVTEIKLSVEEYLDKIRPYLKDIINDLKQSDTWQIDPFTPTRHPTWLKKIQLAFCNPYGGVKTISKESFPYVT